MIALTMTAGMEITYRLTVVPTWGMAHGLPMGWSGPSDILQPRAA